MTATTAMTAIRAPRPRLRFGPVVLLLAALAIGGSTLALRTPIDHTGAQPAAITAMLARHGEALWTPKAKPTDWRSRPDVATWDLGLGFVADRIGFSDALSPFVPIAGVLREFTRTRAPPAD